MAIWAGSSAVSPSSMSHNAFSQHAAERPAGCLCRSRPNTPAVARLGRAAPARRGAPGRAWRRRCQPAAAGPPARAARPGAPGIRRGSAGRRRRRSPRTAAGSHLAVPAAWCRCRGRGRAGVPRPQTDRLNSASLGNVAIQARPDDYWRTMHPNGGQPAKRARRQPVWHRSRSPELNAAVHNERAFTLVQNMGS